MSCTMSTLIPRVPLELQLHILLLSLPSHHSDLSSRASILRKFSFVSRSWRILAQTELFRHVHLDNPFRALDFVTVLGRSDSEDLAHLVRTIKIGVQAVTGGGNEEVVEWTPGFCSADMYKLNYLFSKCDRLEELSLSNVFIKLSELNDGKALRKLFISDSEIVPTPLSSLYLPSLRHLALERCSVHGTSHFFARTHLPSLSAISADYTIPSLFNPTAHQAQSLMETAGSFSDIEGAQSGIRLVTDSAFERGDLKSSSFILVESTAELLSSLERMMSLPSTVKLLRVLNWGKRDGVDRESFLDHFTRALEWYLRHDNSSSRLEEVCLAAGTETVVDDVEEALKSLEQVCLKRGVRLVGERTREVEVDGMGFWRKVEEVEREL